MSTAWMIRGIIGIVLFPHNTAEVEWWSLDEPYGVRRSDIFD